MQIRNVPRTGPRYWTALCIASVFGANLGDFVSHNLHFGHFRGLPPLALIFALTLLAEQRSHANSRPYGNEAFYWIAIVTLRTAATNLGDLTTHDFAWSSLSLIAVLSGALAALVIWAGRRERDVAGAGVPATGWLYWAAMLTAGTLGTVAGDYVADALGLGTLLGSVGLCGAAAGLLAVRALPGMAVAASYWFAVVAIRTAGTTLGDYIAFRHGLNLGLTVSTLSGAALLVAVLALWRPADPARARRLA
jgi:uncharacterized membrane-anchored protein